MGAVRFAISATAVESAPTRGCPQVTTAPFSVRAANAPLTLNALKKQPLTLLIPHLTYILDSQMAPDGGFEVARSIVRSNAQFEAERVRKGFRRKHGSTVG